MHIKAWKHYYHDYAKVADYATRPRKCVGKGHWLIVFKTMKLLLSS
jgi:hypothetical protein